VVAESHATDLDPAQLGLRVLIVAPHPDDESIGCGGLIATLANRGVDINVVIVTDGSGSHPNSLAYPLARLARLRAREATQALGTLGVDEKHVWFCGLRDRFVPARNTPGFELELTEASALLRRFEPATLVTPSVRDTHGDHKATAEIWRAAIYGIKTPPQVLEYIIWPASDACDNSRPSLALDIAPFLPLKRQAIAAHRSQHGLVITDDPSGFIVPPDLLARADAPYETYFEVKF
jgi:LmbE family N-acetylglucosaminyl deacetylase